MSNYTKLIELLNSNFSIPADQKLNGAASIIHKMLQKIAKGKVQFSQETLEVALNKRTITYEEMFKIIEDRIALANRTKHNFKTWELVLAFREENKNTGNYWEESNGTFSVYKY